MTNKFDEYCVWTDDESSLEELDAEHFGKSVRERIEGAMRAKAARQLPAGYFYDLIEETADDFLYEGQNCPENQRRFAEINSAYHELLPAFQILRGYLRDDRVLDGAIRDVMWSSFLIGLACDRERLENPEILERYSSSVTGKARAGRKENQDKWANEVYESVKSAIPKALKASGNFRKATKTTKAAENLKDYVVDEMMAVKWPERLASSKPQDDRAKADLKEELKRELVERLKPAAIRKALGRYIDEQKMDASSSGVPAQDAS